MNLGFADQFVPFVEDGSKTHSIRAGERWKVGMRADCYARPRQKGMRLLLRAPVVRVEEIWIGTLASKSEVVAGSVDIVICGQKLTGDEADLFAWRDGFRFKDGVEGWSAGCFDLMLKFWEKQHDLRRKPFHGQIIHWDYAARFMDIRDTCFHESARRALAARLHR